MRAGGAHRGNDRARARARAREALRPGACAGPRAGLTLLEVLVSAVLVSVGVVVLSQAISGSITAANRADRTADAARIASDLLARLEAGELSILESSEGEEEPDWLWSIETAAGPETDLREVVVRVDWLEPAGPRSLEVVRFFYDRETAR